MDEKIRAYLTDKKVLIVEPSSSVALAAQQFLGKLGVADGNVYITKKLDAGLKYLEEEKPAIVLTEYNIDLSYGLDLVGPHVAAYPNNDDRVFILLTRNSQDSTVAEAAEEDVDGYLLKPFSTKTLEDRLVSIFKAKVTDDPYSTNMKAGKAALTKKKYDDALATFIEAKKHSKSPSLAHFYSGLALEKLGRKDEALNEYEAGLKYNSLHYKCLVAKFEVLDSLERFEDAYTALKQVSLTFPVTPQRLGRMFWLVVRTNQWDDVDKYYELYLGLDRRTEKLTKYVAAGLLVTAKVQFKRGDKERGLDTLKKGVSTSGRTIDFVRRSMNLLYSIGLYEEALEFANMAPPEDRHDKSLQLLQYKCKFHLDNKMQMATLGRDLIKEGKADLEICWMVFSSLIELGSLEAADVTMTNIVKLYPDERPRLFESLTDAKSKTQSASA